MDTLASTTPLRPSNRVHERCANSSLTISPHTAPLIPQPKQNILLHPPHTDIFSGQTTARTNPSTENRTHIERANAPTSTGFHESTSDQHNNNDPSLPNRIPHSVPHQPTLSPMDIPARALRPSRPDLHDRATHNLYWRTTRFARRAHAIQPTHIARCRSMYEHGDGRLH
jgi:hypothetical protein